MNANLRVTLGIAVLFGVSTGIYEFILPLFLREQKVDLVSIGLIFALGGIAMLGARIYMGGLADRWGRKPIYGWALALCGAATALTPFTAGLGWQVVLKMLRDTAVLTRETIHPIVLYEHGRAAFLNLISKFRGVEFMLQAGGTLAAGLLLRAMNGDPNRFIVILIVAGALTLIGAFVWTMNYKEQWDENRQRVIPLRELLNLDLHPNLRIIMFSGIIFTFGLQLSHSFYMPLFFKYNFPGVGDDTVALVMLLHRVTIALPLLVVGNLPLRNLRAWYIFGVAFQGVTIIASGLLHPLWLSAGVFLLHDLIGAGIWSPIQATLIQRYSREHQRGLEVGKVLAWGSIGSILGPLAAGFMAEYATWLPFVASGIFSALAAVPLLGLKLEKSPRADSAVTV